jgi:hypothetical protein
MLKLVRVTRISGLIQKLTVSRASKAVFKLLQLIFFLILFIHFQACIFFFIARQYNKWIPNFDFIYKGTDIYDSKLLLLNRFRKPFLSVLDINVLLCYVV